MKTSFERFMEQGEKAARMEKENNKYIKEKIIPRVNKLGGNVQCIHDDILIELPKNCNPADIDDIYKLIGGMKNESNIS